MSKCSDCAFWLADKKWQKGEGGEFYADCRRHAPSVIARASGNANYQNPETAWPGTTQEDWCGDWVLMPTSLNEEL